MIGQRRTDKDMPYYELHRRKADGTYAEYHETYEGRNLIALHAAGPRGVSEGCITTHKSQRDCMDKIAEMLDGGGMKIDGYEFKGHIQVVD